MAGRVGCCVAEIAVGRAHDLIAGGDDVVFLRHAGAAHLQRRAYRRSRAGPCDGVVIQRDVIALHLYHVQPRRGLRPVEVVVEDPRRADIGLEKQMRGDVLIPHAVEVVVVNVDIGDRGWAAIAVAVRAVGPQVDAVMVEGIIGGVPRGCIAHRVAVEIEVGVVSGSRVLTHADAVIEIEHRVVCHGDIAAAAIQQPRPIVQGVAAERHVPSPVITDSQRAGRK